MVKIILIGAGHRGRKIYGEHILRNGHNAKIVAVAEINQERREMLAKQHGISDTMQFSSWQELIKNDIPADAVLIATGDKEHFEPTIAFLKKGYHILCEKPMASNPKECLEMQRVAEECGKILAISHVLRYTPFYKGVKELLDAGQVGRVISVQYNENVGIDSFVHGYVRGIWRNTELAAPMILAKCCHDTDIISWLLGKKYKKVYSAGDLTFFNSKNAPKGCAERCTDGCSYEKDCQFSAIKAYVTNMLNKDVSVHDEWVKSIAFVIGAGEDTSVEGRIKALETGDFGKCAFQCDNNVVDHQVAVFEMEDDITVAFTMCGFTKYTCRTFKIMGTAGELNCNMLENRIEFRGYNGDKKIIQPNIPIGGHGGGDAKLVESFIEFLSTADVDHIVSSGRQSVHSHIVGFAVEQSRISGNSVVIEEYEKEILKV